MECHGQRAGWIGYLFNANSVVAIEFKLSDPIGPRLSMTRISINPSMILQRHVADSLKDHGLGY